MADILLKYLTDLPFDGFALGGSFGKNHQEMFDMLEFTMPMLPKDRPNHLLGIADLNSIEPCIKLGIDTFDSSHPTRCARHGQLFTRQGTVKILNSCNRSKYEPVDASCSCVACTQYTCAYMHHLFKAKEITGLILATIHNLTFMVDLMRSYRQAIVEDRI